MVGKILVLVGGLLVAGSGFLLWIDGAFIDGTFETLKYVDSVYGKLAIVVGVLLMGTAIALFVRPENSLGLGTAGAVLGLLALVIAAISVLDSSDFDEYERIAAAAPVPGPDKGGAPYVAAFGALLALGGGMLTRRGSAPASGGPTVERNSA